MAGSLAGPIARIDRAISHYHALKGSFFGVDRKMWPVYAERHRDGLEYTFHLGPGVPQLDAAWQVELGEAYHCLRVALDNLAFQLHWQKCGRAPSKTAARKSSFPIYRDQPVDEHTGRPIPPNRWPAIKRLDAPVQALIADLQPYQGWAHQYPPPTETEQIRLGLAHIHELDLIDKHRHLHIAGVILQGVPAGTFDPALGFRQSPAFRVPLTSHAKVDTWTFAQEPPPDAVNMHGYVTLTVGIQPPERLPGPQLDAFPHLGGAIHVTAMVIDKFRYLFPRCAGPDLGTLQGRMG